jgi:hypothetical protein
VHQHCRIRDSIEGNCTNQLRACLVWGRIIANHRDFGKSYTFELQQNHGITFLLWFWQTKPLNKNSTNFFKKTCNEFEIVFWISPQVSSFRISALGTCTKSPSPQGLFFTVVSWYCDFGKSYTLELQQNNSINLIELGTFHLRVSLYNVMIPIEEKQSYQSGINKLVRHKSPTLTYTFSPCRPAWWWQLAKFP